MTIDPKIKTCKSSVVALDIGGTKVQGALVVYDDTPEPLCLYKQFLSTKAAGGADGLLRQVIDLARTIIGQGTLDGYPQPIAVGIGCSGRIDARHGLIRWSNATMPDWSGLPLADLVASELNCPVFVLNDVQAHGLGEARFGAARGVSYGLMVACGTGLGGAIIAQGHLFLGARGFAGEIGHTLSPDAIGMVCACQKPSHIERVASGSGIERCYVDAGGEALSAKVIDERAKAGEELARQTLRKAGFALGSAIGSWASILDPEVVIVGGSVAQAGFYWHEGLAKGFAEQKPQAMDDLKIVYAALGGEAPLFGAAEYARDRLDEGA